MKYQKLSDVPQARVGSTYGRLTVERQGARKGKHRTWVCRCQCGNFKEILDQSLRSGRTTSCGCAYSVARSHGHTVGGQSKTYMAWRDMIQRCDNPNHKSYPHYGGRGVTYTPGWATFDRFLSDMGEAPPGLSLDRVNVEDGYHKSNCVWADWFQQAKNKRSCGASLIEYGGESLTVGQWALRLGISEHTIRGRRKKGWPTEMVLSAVSWKGKCRGK